MSHIRITIELLSTILRENGTERIKAETFRLAKFDQNEVAHLLWKLLFQLIYYCENGEIDSVTYKAFANLSQDEIAVYVKKMLLRLGYHSPEFSSLPKDMSSGSRELLLAVGWLICKENVIQRFMQSCTSPLEDEDVTLVSDKRPNVEPVFDCPTLIGNTIDRVKQMLWFNNKLRMNLRLLHAASQEKHQLKHKIHEATYGISTDPERNHLTLYEVHLLKHPDALKKNLDLLEKDNERLSNLLKWKDHEDIFWKWMESVLDEKLKENIQDEKSSEASTSRSVDSGIGNIIAESTSYLVECHNSLQECIMKYEYIVDQLESLWESKAVDIRESDLDNILREIDIELCRQRENVYRINCKNYLGKQNTQPRFIYEKIGDNNKGKSVSTGYAAKSPSYVHSSLEHIQDIEDEILMLQGTVDTLEKDINVKQENFKSELQQISDRLSGVVCIPPMGRRLYNH